MCDLILLGMGLEGKEGWCLNQDGWDGRISQDLGRDQDGSSTPLTRRDGRMDQDRRSA